MKTTEQKINLQLNIDGYKFFETNQSFDDDQTYSNLIQGFMDDLDYKLENMGDSEDEPVMKNFMIRLFHTKNQNYKYQLILIFQKKKLIVSYLIYNLSMIEILW